LESEVQYEKVLLLDIDTFPLKSLHELFNLDAPAAFAAGLMISLDSRVPGIAMVQSLFFGRLVRLTCGNNKCNVNKWSLR
jgi:hypothetical protein